MTTTNITRDEVVELISTLAAIENRGAYATHRLTSARDALGRHDARPYWWTAEHYAIALRDAANAARLGIRYWFE